MVDAPATPWPLAPDVDATTAIVMREFMLLGRLQRQQMHRAFAKQLMHPGQAVCIAVLAHRGEMAQSELAEALVLSRPSVTRLLQRMERGGLVHRRTDESDQRQTLVELTPTGRELQHRMYEASADFATGTLARLSADDRADLARILPTWRRLAEEAQS